MKNPIAISFVISSLALSSGLVGCGGTQQATAGPSSQGSDEAAQPSDPSKPIGPKAANAGQCPGTDLIDDFEDGDSRSAQADMRGGYWYTYADSKSTVEPKGNFSAFEGGAGGSAFSGRMSGEITSEEQYPYVGLGVSFTEPKQPYDASCCKGVSFQGKKSGETNAKVRFKVGDWQTSPEGGLCQQCFNDFGADLMFTDEWTEYAVMFADMKQEPYWGEPKAAIDPTALYQLQWQVNEKGQPFDIQIDDVKFVGCGK